MSELPFFKCYPADLISSSSVMMMSNEAFGIYIKLLCHEWMSGGIPCDLNRMARLVAASSAEMSKRWPEMQDCFYLENNVYRNLRLEEERERAHKQHVKLSRAGEKGRKVQRQNRINARSQAIGEAKGDATDDGQARLSLADDPAYQMSDISEEPPKGPPKPTRLSREQKKRMKVKLNTPVMEKIGAWFGRKPSTLWTLYEAEALVELGHIPEEDLELLESYYTGDHAQADVRRRDITTLLNNWAGELDRARAVANGSRGKNPSPGEGTGMSLGALKMEESDLLTQIRDIRYPGGCADAVLLEGEKLTEFQNFSRKLKQVRELIDSKLEKEPT